MAAAAAPPVAPPSQQAVFSAEASEQQRPLVKHESGKSDAMGSLVNLQQQHRVKGPHQLEGRGPGLARAMTPSPHSSSRRNVDIKPLMEMMMGTDSSSLVDRQDSQVTERPHLNVEGSPVLPECSSKKARTLNGRVAQQPRALPPQSRSEPFSFSAKGTVAAAAATPRASEAATPAPTMMRVTQSTINVLTAQVVRSPEPPVPPTPFNGAGGGGGAGGPPPSPPGGGGIQGAGVAAAGAHPPPIPPRTERDPYWYEIPGNLVGIHDGRDKPLKFLVAFLGLTQKLHLDAGGDPAINDRITAAKEAFSDARAVVGLFNIFNGCIVEGVEAAQLAAHHARHLSQETAARDDAEYPGVTGRILGFLKQVATLCEKIFFSICFAICQPVRFADKCAKGQLSETAKSIGNGFKYFWMGFHLAGFVGNLSELIRKGLIIGPKGSAADQEKWAREMRVVSLKLIENMCDIAVDIILVASLLLMVQGYLVVSLSLLSASLGLFAIIEKVSITPVKIKPSPF